jgi:hypothetical protein
LPPIQFCTTSWSLLQQAHVVSQFCKCLEFRNAKMNSINTYEKRGTKRKHDGESEQIQKRSRTNIKSIVWEKVKNVQSTLSTLTFTMSLDDTLLQLVESFNALQQWKKKHLENSNSSHAEIILSISDAYAQVQQIDTLMFDKSVIEHNLRVAQSWNAQAFQTIAEKDSIIHRQISELNIMHANLQQAQHYIVNLQHEKYIANLQHDLDISNLQQQHDLLEEKRRLLEIQLQRPDNCICKNFMQGAPQESLIQDLEKTSTWLQAKSKLKIVHGQLVLQLKENKIKYTEDFRRCSAQLLRSNVRSCNVSPVIQIVCDFIGVTLQDDLPTHQFYINTLHEYVLYGDLEWVYEEQGKAQVMHVDDASRQGKSYQNVAVITKQDNSLREHVTGVTRIMDKTAETKLQGLQEISQYYRSIISTIYDGSISEDASDIIMNMLAKVSDRCATETKLANMIKKIQSENHHPYRVIEIKCGTHLGNTSTEAAKIGRANHFHLKLDPGYDLITRIIKEVRSNPHAKGFLYECLKKDFRFRDQRKSRFYQNMIYTNDIILMIGAMKEFVEFEHNGVALLGERKKDHLAELQRLHELLHSADALTSLYVINIERHKVLAPYLQLIKKLPTAYKFYPALSPVLLHMQQTLADDEKLRSLMLNPADNVFSSDLVKESVFQLEGVNHELALKLMKIMLTCWLNKLSIIVTKFAENGELYLQDSTTYDHILNNNNLGESVVASLSRSVKFAPNGSAKFHENSVKLRRNQFPSKQFVMEVLSEEQRKLVRKQVRNNQQQSEAKKAIQRSQQSLQKYRETIKKKQATIAKKQVNMTDENTNKLKSLTEDEINSMKKSELHKHLSAGNAKVGGKKEEMAYRLMRLVQYRNLTQSTHELIHERIKQLMANMSIDKSNINATVYVAGEPSSVVDHAEVQLVVIDTETAFSGAKDPVTQIHREGGRQFWQWCSLPLSGDGFNTYAKRDYITPVKNKISITAKDSCIKHAPDPITVTKARMKWEEEQNATELILLYWATNEFDVNVDNDALEEADLTRKHNVWYLNALKLVKLLLPGLPSYSLEKIHDYLGFGSYDAHNAFYDCIATWHVILYALLVVYGLDAITDAESVTIFIQSLMGDFALGVPAKGSDYIEPRVHERAPLTSIFALFSQVFSASVFSR